MSFQEATAPLLLGNLEHLLFESIDVKHEQGRIKHPRVHRALARVFDYATFSYQILGVGGISYGIVRLCHANPYDSIEHLKDIMDGGIIMIASAGVTLHAIASRYQLYRQSQATINEKI